MGKAPRRFEHWRAKDFGDEAALFAFYAASPRFKDEHEFLREQLAYAAEQLGECVHRLRAAGVHGPNPRHNRC